jgi:hypothetical protein
MWFKAKPKNRRLAREYVLDVKVRSNKARRARARTTAIAFGVALAFLFGVFLLWRAGEWGLNLLVYENKAFAMRELDLQTDGIIALDQLRRWTPAKPGENLLALDLARIKRDLEMVPLIQSVSVERILPHTLRIRIVEREPIAQINFPKPGSNSALEFSVFYLDPEGYVMVPLDARQRSTSLNQPDEQLPIISGIKPHEVRPGRRLESRQVRAALQLLVSFEHSPMVGFADFRRLDVSGADVLVATTGQGGEITFALTDLEQQLRRWREIVDSGQKIGKAIASLDLAIPNNIPARWLEASAVPPVPPKMPKLLRNKKKHV